MKHSLVKAKSAADTLGISLQTFAARARNGHYKVVQVIDGSKFYDLEQIKNTVYQDKRYKPKKTYTAQELEELFNQSGNLFVFLAEVLKR